MANVGGVRTRCVGGAGGSVNGSRDCMLTGPRTTIEISPAEILCNSPAQQKRRLVPPPQPPPANDRPAHDSPLARRVDFDYPTGELPPMTFPSSSRLVPSPAHPNAKLPGALGRGFGRHHRPRRRRPGTRASANARRARARPELRNGSMRMTPPTRRAAGSYCSAN